MPFHLVPARDRKLYRLAMHDAIESVNGLDIIEGEADDFIIEDGKIAEEWAVSALAEQLLAVKH